MVKKRILSVILSAAMIFSLNVPAFAEEIVETDMETVSGANIQSEGEAEIDTVNPTVTFKNEVYMATASGYKRYTGNDVTFTGTATDTAIAIGDNLTAPTASGVPSGYKKSGWVNKSHLSKSPFLEYKAEYNYNDGGFYMVPFKNVTESGEVYYTTADWREGESFGYEITSNMEFVYVIEPNNLHMTKFYNHSGPSYHFDNEDVPDGGFMLMSNGKIEYIDDTEYGVVPVVLSPTNINYYGLKTNLDYEEKPALDSLYLLSDSTTEDKVTVPSISTTDDRFEFVGWVNPQTVAYDNWYDKDDDGAPATPIKYVQPGDKVLFDENDTYKSDYSGDKYETGIVHYCPVWKLKGQGNEKGDATPVKKSSDAYVERTISSNDGKHTIVAMVNEAPAYTGGKMRVADFISSFKLDGKTYAAKDIKIKTVGGKKVGSKVSVELNKIKGADKETNKAIKGLKIAEITIRAIDASEVTTWNKTYKQEGQIVVKLKNAEVKGVWVVVPKKGVNSGESKAKKIKVPKDDYSYDKTTKTLTFKDSGIVKGSVKID